MTIDEVERLAMSLPEVVQEPHFQMTSFRIRGKIFATITPDKAHLHLFVAEQERETMVTLHPEAYEKLWWGSKVVGLRVKLPAAATGDMQELLRSAWLRKAPKKLLNLLQKDRDHGVSE